MNSKTIKGKDIFDSLVRGEITQQEANDLVDSTIPYCLDDYPVHVYSELSIEQKKYIDDRINKKRDRDEYLGTQIGEWRFDTFKKLSENLINIKIINDSVQFHTRKEMLKELDILINHLEKFVDQEENSDLSWLQKASLVTGMDSFDGRKNAKNNSNR